MTAVPVPATPAGATECRPVAPGSLAVWRIPMPYSTWVTITLGVSDGVPWAELATGPGSIAPRICPAHDQLVALGRLTAAIASAHGWLARWHQVAPEPEAQPSLFKDSTA